jgi:UDP-N-acetylmuramoyl-tripeptide--D-alanyl-D-alanine ligase
VAGSVGKTTTKEILAALLSARYRVLKSQGNLNNEFGLPLTLLQLNEQHEAVVLEMGMSRAGELGRLAKIAEPDAGVITRVAVEHLEFFSSIGEIAKAERELIENLPGAHAAAVLNLDDERVARFADVAPGKVIWFGESHAADFRAENVEDRGIRGTALILCGRRDGSDWSCRWLGGTTWATPWRRWRRRASGEWERSKRGKCFRGCSPRRCAAKSWSSRRDLRWSTTATTRVPLALAAAAELIAATEGYRRRILAAGEMLELGTESAELHREAGRSVGAAGKRTGSSVCAGPRRKWCGRRSRRGTRANARSFSTIPKRRPAF